MNIYQQNGYKSRKDYLAYLAEEYEPSAVYALSNLLGESEDFDGLVTALEDYEGDF